MDRGADRDRAVHPELSGLALTGGPRTDRRPKRWGTSTAASARVEGPSTPRRTAQRPACGLPEPFDERALKARFVSGLTGAEKGLFEPEATMPSGPGLDSTPPPHPAAQSGQSSSRVGGSRLFSVVVRCAQSGKMRREALAPRRSGPSNPWQTDHAVGTSRAEGHETEAGGQARSSEWVMVDAHSQHSERVHMPEHISDVAIRTHHSGHVIKSRRDLCQVEQTPRCERLHRSEHGLGHNRAYTMAVIDAAI